MSFSRSNSTNYVSYKNHILLKEDYLAHILDSIGVKYYWYFVLMYENQWWCETRHIEALLSRVSVIVGSSKPVVITRTIGSEEKKKDCLGYLQTPCQCVLWKLTSSYRRNGYLLIFSMLRLFSFTPRCIEKSAILKQRSIGSLSSIAIFPRE